MKLSLIGLIFILGFSLLANAAPLGCQSYQSPVLQTLPYLQKIVYFDNNPPMCADDFLAFLRSDKSNPMRDAAWEKALQISKKNVRILHCDDGDGNVIFKNKKVFLTVAHAFYSLNKRNFAKDRFSNQAIHHCYVMNGGKKNYVDIKKPPDFGDPTVDPSLDYGVGAVENPMDDIEPLEIARSEDFAKDQEIMVASAFRDNAIGRNCFSAALCFDRKFWGATQDFSSIHSTNCPSDPGSSGSAEFILKFDAEANEYKVLLAHIYHGGTYSNDPNGRPYPDGRPYFYAKDIHDPNGAFSMSVGIDGTYRQKIEAFIKEIEARNPPGSLEPQSHNQNAEFIPRGQSL